MYIYIYIHIIYTNNIYLELQVRKISVFFTLKDFLGSISGFCPFQSDSIFQLKCSFVELFGNRPEAGNLDCPFAFG